MLRLYLHMGVLYTASYKMNFKGLPRYDFKSTAFLCIIGICVMNLNRVETQTNATELLALKEGELNMFVDAVERNSGDCDVMKGCSGKNCSRLVCYRYGTPGDSNYQCLGVANNTYLCDTPSCTQRNFDFTRSSVRRVDTVDSHIARTVCTHRTLDAHFINSTMSNSSHLFRVYFGAVDGTSRLYPGADELCDNEVDNRIRPWYLASINIPKVVIVLIDSGLLMRGTIPATDHETYISKATTTALKLLETLGENVDYVKCICFDGDGIKELDAVMVYNVTVYQSLNESLTRMVMNVSKSDPTAAHTNSAINLTINQLGQLTDSKLIPSNYLKVVVAFIGGQQYRNISDLNVTQIPNVNLFIYSFRTGQAPQCIPALRASLEEIPEERRNNPLYALLSYYSFLGKLYRSFMKNETTFGPQYKDYSGIDNHTLTLSKAAFGANGELLGVVGLDFFELKVQESYSNIQWQSIVEEAGKRDPGRIFNTLTDLSTNVCFNQTDPCPGLDSAGSEFLCKPASNDPKIGCCGTCRANKKQEHELKHWMISLIVVAAVLCCLGVYVVYNILTKSRLKQPTSIVECPRSPPNPSASTSPTRS